MTILRTLSGFGEIKDGGAVIGSGYYRIDITQQANGLRSGEGTLRAEADVLFRAFEARSLTITREDTGKDISIAFESASFFEDEAPIRLRGSPD